MSCISPIQVQSPLQNGKYIYVPCGKCAWCRRDKQVEWYLRFKVEQENSLFTKFITLTYSDENLPFFLDEDTGEFGYRAKKSDVQKFIKRMRKKGFKFKYFLVSEYAPKTRRPHYHALFFTDDDITDDDVRNSWEHGVTDTQNADEGSLMYVTKYILKGNDRDGNFKLQSTRPAIGNGYIKRINAIRSLQEDENGIQSNKMVLFGKKYPLPRYYKKKFLQLYPDIWKDFNRIKLIHAMEERPKLYYLEKKFEKHDLLLRSPLESQQKLLESIRYAYGTDNKKQFDINNKEFKNYD